MEKNLIALDKSAISNLDYQYNNNQNSNLLTLNQNTLDIYLPKSEINLHINKIEDLGQLRDIRNKGKMIMDVSDTRLKRLVVKVA